VFGVVVRERIRRLGAGLLLAAACLAAAGCDLSDGGGDAARMRQGLRLHPDNPRYLLFRGEPTVLITSGEHYGAVVNADFDYVRYLDELARFGFNLTRVFSGSYIEPKAPTSSGSPTAWSLGYENTLAPRPGRFVSPWARSEAETPGGPRRFDLAKWNPAYFDRLKRFIREAGQRGIIVEVVLFSALYEFAIWSASPFNAENNVNGVGAIDARRLYTLDNGGVLKFQDAFVRKLVTELRSFDNLYYEVINEGWAEPAPASDGWQDHIIKTIEDAEAALPQKHLIARNYRHDRRIADPHPSVSIFNFHYQRDVSQYGNLEGVLSFDETGLQGTADRPYRTDGWFFMLSGGGVYSNLDWSFTPDSEDGSAGLPAAAPGGGGRSLRRSLAVLKTFLERFDLPQMSPSHEIVTGAPPGATTRVLADPGNSYAIYVVGGRPGPLVLDLPAGRYRAEWIDTKDGAVMRRESLDDAGFETTLDPPSYEDDIALAIEAD
jgi:hypothetical protein